jgi:hypothetical protein
MAINSNIIWELILPRHVILIPALTGGLFMPEELFADYLNN